MADDNEGEKKPASTPITKAELPQEGDTPIAGMTPGEKSMFHVLACELEDPSVEMPENQSISSSLTNTTKHHNRKSSWSPGGFLEKQVTLPKRKFWGTTDEDSFTKLDPFHAFPEGEMHVMSVGSDHSLIRNEVQVPTLKECRAALVNEELEKYRHWRNKPYNRVWDLVLDVLSAFFIYFSTTVGFETVIVIVNAAMATYYFTENYQRFAAKLDFAFLAMSIVFPLTFLVQSTFNRREQALSWLADFKGAVLASTLFKLTVDWPDKNGNPDGGRRALPKGFNVQVVRDSRLLIKLTYEYLSMPNVSHARNVVCWEKQNATMRVRALQNDIVKKLTNVLYDLSMQTEEMKRYGFPTGEASRLHQYHQYIRQRFEHLRVFKYYRTPQSTRSFGLAYILMLPWLTGPYFAWVFEETTRAIAIVLACFTYLILLGLLNAQKVLEDPYITTSATWTPGVDTIKLDFELATVLQGIEQYFANAELKRIWDASKGRKDFVKNVLEAEHLVVKPRSRLRSEDVLRPEDVSRVE